MDFATVRNKLANGSYSTLEQFEVGVQFFVFEVIHLLSFGNQNLYWLFLAFDDSTVN